MGKMMQAFGIEAGFWNWHMPASNGSAFFTGYEKNYE